MSQSATTPSLAEGAPPKRRLEPVDYVHMAATVGLGVLMLAKREVSYVLLFLGAVVITIGVLWVRFFGTRRQPPRVKLRREGLAFSGLTILFGLAAANTGSNMLYLCTAAMLAFLVLSGVLSSLTFLRLGVKLPSPERAQAGSASPLVLRLENRKLFLGSYCVRLGGARETKPGAPEWRVEPAMVLRVPARSELAVTLLVTPLSRGLQPQPSFQVSSRFPFAFIDKWYAVRGTDEVLVLPAVGQMLWRGLRQLSSSGSSVSTAAHDHGDDVFRGVREYRPGDNPRLVHWKTSARVGQLRIRELERARQGRSLLVLCCAGATLPEERQLVELGVSCCATVLVELLAGGMTVDLVTDDPELAPSRALAGNRDRQVGLELLARYRVERATAERLAQALAASSAARERRNDQIWIELGACDTSPIGASLPGRRQQIILRAGGLEGRFVPPEILAPVPAD